MTTTPPDHGHILGSNDSDRNEASTGADSIDLAPCNSRSSALAYRPCKTGHTHNADDDDGGDGDACGGAYAPNYHVQRLRLK